jgi:RecA-family ATPase
VRRSPNPTVLRWFCFRKGQAVTVASHRKFAGNMNISGFSDDAVTPLPTTRASQLAQPETTEPAWLIEGLWSKEAVGIIGGEPKCGKSFLALDLAVAVASGSPCLRHFPTRQSGTVLSYSAEDATYMVRQRLEGIAYAADVDFESLDIHVITVPTLRLDCGRDREALEATVAHLRPKLIILDPFVRLHAIDENVAGEVAPLLAYLRSLQRQYHTAVALVHHARKGAAHERGGQALRGSSELHAWGDSNLAKPRICISVSSIALLPVPTVSSSL